MMELKKTKARSVDAWRERLKALDFSSSAAAMNSSSGSACAREAAEQSREFRLAGIFLSMGNSSTYFVFHKKKN
jgi:hypothetical protein